MALRISVDHSLKLEKMTSSLTFGLIIIYFELSVVVRKFWPVYIITFDAVIVIGRILSIKRHGTIMGIKYEMIICLEMSFIVCAIFIVYMLTSAKRVDIPTSFLEEPMMLSLTSYSSHQEAADSWDQIQFSSQCCGVHNYSDWFGMPLHGNGYDRHQFGSPK